MIPGNIKKGFEKFINLLKGNPLKLAGFAGLVLVILIAFVLLFYTLSRNTDIFPEKSGRSFQKSLAGYDLSFFIEENAQLENRLDRLEKEYSRLDFMVNPHQIMEGLFIDIDITTIKRKKTTLDSIAGILNEFLPCLFAVFQDTAYTLTFGAESSGDN